MKKKMKKKMKRFLALVAAFILLIPGNVQAETINQNTGTEERCGLREFEVNYVDHVDEADIIRTPKLKASDLGYWTNFSSDYFYNQLSVSQKNLYDALDSMCYNYMTSTENMTISGSYAQTKYVSYSGMSSEEATNIAYLFALTEGQYYFLNDVIWNSYIPSINAGQIALGAYEIYADGNTRMSQTNQLKNQLDSWLSDIKTGTTKLAREKRAHDIIVDAVTYEANDYDQSCISIIRTGKTVCAGYAKMFGMLCNAAGIETITLTSATHAWNAVQISGAWYNVDCTWDDPDYGTHIYYTYFNKSDTTLQSGNNSHFVVDKWYTYTTVPTCSLDTVTADEVATEKTTSVPVYRLFNPNSGEHLYTTDVNEKDTIYRYQGWGYEGIAWYAAQGTGDPVYRLCNPKTGYHLYTTDVNEVNVLTTSQGWTKDFNGQPLFYSSGSVPVYRLFNGVHHLTTDANEYKVLPQNGWQQEGVKMNAVKTGQLTETKYYTDETSSVPVYRLFNPNSGEHFYTTDANEKDIIYKQGWGYEGIAWYAAQGTGDPVYRLCNPKTGYHLYTTDVNEVNVLTTSQGWTKDFDGQPLFYSGGSVPVYQLFQGVHHLTTDVNEYNILPQSGWQQEGEKIRAVKPGELMQTQYYKNY